MLSVFDKLAAKIKNDLGITVVDIKRRYTGINMKATGAFCWAGKEDGGVFEIGSSTPATELLKAKKLILTKGWGFGEMEVVAQE